jgi:hypothetical protein
VAIEALNICFVREYILPVLTPTPGRTRAIKRITGILVEQLHFTWQSQRYVKEVRTRQAISDYLGNSLVRSIPTLRDGSLSSRVDGGLGAGDTLNFQAEARHAIHKIHCNWKRSISHASST